MPITNINIIKQSSVVLFDQGITSIVTLCIGIALARSCSKADFGMFFLGMTLIYLVEVIHRSLVMIPLTFLSRKMSPSDKKTLFGNSLIQHILLTILLCFLALLSSFFPSAYQLWLPQNSTIVYFIIAAAGYHFKSFTRSALLADLKVNSALYMNGAANILTLLSLGFLFYAKNLSTSSAYFTIGVTSFISAIISIFSHKSFYSFNLYRLSRSIRDNWDYGKWIFGAVLANALGVRAIPWILSGLKGPEAVAIFAAISNVGAIINPLITGLSSYISPKFAKCAHDNGFIATIDRGLISFKTSILVTILYSFFMLIYGDFFVSILFTKSYTGFHVAIAALALQIGIKGSNFVLSSILRSINKPNSEFYNSTISTSVTLLIGWPLIEHMGINGATIAMLISFIIVTLFNYAAILRAKRYIIKASLDSL